MVLVVFVVLVCQPDDFFFAVTFVDNYRNSFDADRLQCPQDAKNTGKSGRTRITHTRSRFDENNGLKSRLSEPSFTAPE